MTEEKKPDLFGGSTELFGGIGETFAESAELMFGSGGDMFAQEVDEWAMMSEPLEGEPPEEHSKRVLGLVEQGFRDRAKAEDARYKQAVDGEFWVCVVFQTHEQKDQFLANAGVNVEAMGDKYIDGWELAKTLKIPLDRAEMRYNISDKLDRRLIELSRDHPELSGLGDANK